jgi:hypothetical protein
MENRSEIDNLIRRVVYAQCMQSGLPPTAREIATVLGLSQRATRDSLMRLADGHILVLQPASGEILMASPFSAVPTSFLVEVNDFTCYANCIWDALAVPAMLNQDACLKTSCGDCGQALELSVLDGQVQAEGGIVHFALPARQWWEDIVFT